MRQSEDLPMDPELLAELEAIDATLAGEAVDPVHAELAELALLLAAERPAIPAEVAERLDSRVAGRFGAETAPGGSRSWWTFPAWWTLRPALGALATGLAALVVVVVALHSGSAPVRGLRAAAGASNGTVASPPASSSSSASRPSLTTLAAPVQTISPNGANLRAPGNVKSASSPQSATTAATTPSVSATPAPGQPAFNSAAPVSHGRKQIQSAQLQLVTPENRIEAVSQELFQAVGQAGGIVRSSQITDSQGNGYADFSLSIPSGNLPTTMSQLSTLRYAHVGSRTDATQDVNGQYLSDVRRLADARALRTSLLKQLAAAITQTQIASLTAQIHDAEASIASDEATLRGLDHQISYSNLSVQINAGSVPGPVASGRSSGFTIGKAAHDAVRVLTVAAGVALIALAALVPFALLAALGLWISLTLRRRRREQALDAA